MEPTIVSVSIPVDAETARIYGEASPEDQQRIQLLLGLRLHEIIQLPQMALTELLDTIGERVAMRGLTSEILQDILNERD